MSRLQKMIWSAQRPIMILGGSRWSENAWAATQRFAERFDLPVFTTFRRGHLFDQTHPNYGGDLGIGTRETAFAALLANQQLPEEDFNLVTIALFETKVTDADLARLDQFPHLTTLNLHSTDVGAEDVVTPIPVERALHRDRCVAVIECRGVLGAYGYFTNNIS